MGSRDLPASSLTRVGHQLIAGWPVELPTPDHYRRVALCPDGYGMSRLVMLPIARQVTGFPLLSPQPSANLCRSAHRAWGHRDTLRSKGPEADYLAVVRGLIQDSGRLHRNNAACLQPAGWSADELAGNRVQRPVARPGGRIAGTHSPGANVGSRPDVTPRKVPTWRRSAAKQGVRQGAPAVELSI